MSFESINREAEARMDGGNFDQDDDEFIVGYCKECGAEICNTDKFKINLESDWIYECMCCGHPHRFDELTPFDM